jgi:Ca2+-binding EF-hand superfamily protein
LLSFTGPRFKFFFQRYFDKDRNGYIDARELEDVFKKLGKYVSRDEIARMIKAADNDGNGLISFDEFEKILNM